MTNGEKMQEMFPEGKTRRCKGGVVFESDGWCHAYNSDWWNTEHKEPTTKNDSSGLDKNSKKLEKDFGELDCISRQAVLELIADDNLSMGQVVRGIHALPPVTPQESRWISVEERMPEEDTDVLVTLKCGLIGIMQKKLADDDNGEPCYIWQDFEGEEHEVIAWMPLPKPYREVEE